MSLAEEDEVVQALVLDRLHEPLRVRIAVRTPRRDLHAGDAPGSQDIGERLREQRVSIVDQEFCFAEEAVDGIGQVAGDLFHPLPGGIDLNPGYLDRAGSDLQDEEDHVSDRAEDAENLDAEEVTGYERKLTQEKQKFGVYDDGAGKRYFVGPLYLLLGDLDGAMKSFAWYEREFPDDSGEAGHFLCWSLALFRSGDTAKAADTLRRAMFADRYVLPKLLGLKADEVGIKRADPGGVSRMYVEGIPEAYYSLWSPEERAWASTRFSSSAWADMRNRFFEFEKLLETEPRGSRRKALVDELFGLMG